MVAFAADYRTKSKHKTEPKACVSDGKVGGSLDSWKCGEIRSGSKKIIAGGGSAGGHVAATTATIQAFDESSDDLSISPKPQALLLFNPVIDNSEKGYGYSRVEAYWKEFSPMHNIKTGNAPDHFYLRNEGQSDSGCDRRAIQEEDRESGWPLRSPLVQRCKSMVSSMQCTRRLCLRWTSFWFLLDT